MKKRMRLLIFLLTSVLLTGGCGTTVYELTEEEEDLVVEYAAYALAKHNIYQKDGMTSALPAQEETHQEQQQNTQQVTDYVNSAGGGAGPDVVVTGETISLAGAIGHDTDLKVSYEGYSLKDSYQEGDYFSVNANEGKTLLVMEFRIKNPGKKTVNLDTVFMKNEFSACVDGSRWIPEKISFGTSSLSSYDGKIKTGETKKAVLIFEISEETVESIDTVSLSVKMEDKTYSVEL